MTLILIYTGNHRGIPDITMTNPMPVDSRENHVTNQIIAEVARGLMVHMVLRSVESRTSVQILTLWMRLLARF